MKGQDIYKRWNESDKTIYDTMYNLKNLINSDILMYHIEQDYKFHSQIHTSLFINIMINGSADLNT